jgi:hypothetical protein
MADPAFFDRLIPTLRAQGLKDSAIWKARRLWLATPSYESVRPCPMCSDGQRQGRLRMTSRQAGAERFECRDCAVILKMPLTAA